MTSAVRSMLILPCLLVGAVPAAAETVEAVWDSYFYDAPRYSARVLDEVRPAERLDVLSCAESWCRVRFGEAEGYVREIVVRGPGAEVKRGEAARGGDCFSAQQPGGAKWQTERFCHEPR